MRDITVSVGPLVAASANAICLSQTPTAGALTLNGSLVVAGVAIMDTPRRVLITTTGNESSRTFTIVGTDANGSPATEIVTGPSISTAQSVLDYKTVTSITISGNAAAALTVGTSGVASSRWVRLDPWALPNVSVQCTVTGTVNYTVETSMQDPNSPTNVVSPYLMTWLSSPDPNVVGATTTQASYFANAPLWARVTLNSGTGSVSTVLAQMGVVQR
jgi:hypothetical protein